MAGPSAPAQKVHGSTRRRDVDPWGKPCDLKREISTVVHASRRRSGSRPISDLGLDLGAVALARGLKLAGAEAITTYRDSQTAEGAAPAEGEAPARQPHSGRASGGAEPGGALG
jgi:hypothetical protein